MIHRRNHELGLTAARFLELLTERDGAAAEEAAPAADAARPGPDGAGPDAPADGRRGARVRVKP